MTYGFLAIASYFLSALATSVDKVLLKKRISDPLVFAFYTGVSSVAIVAIVPFFGLSLLSLPMFALACATGAVFLWSLHAMYIALSLGDASRVAPLIGGSSPIFTLALSALAFGYAPAYQELLALASFILGGTLLSLEYHERRAVFRARLTFFALLAGFLLALTFVLSKELYERVPFLSGFIWTRIGSALIALLPLAVPRFRQRIFAGAHATSASSGGLFLMNKVIGAGSFIVLNYAIAVGSASVVSALRGFEYLFVFLIVSVLSMPQIGILRERFDTRAIMQKILGAVIMGMGFAFIMLP